LERRLGVQLLHRSTRSLTTTEIGRELYERARGILSALEDTHIAIQQSQVEPQGLLRLTCGVEFGLLVVNHWIADYLKKYPRVRVEVDFSNRTSDLIHEGFDVGIRIGNLPDVFELSARKLGALRYALYASPAYLAANPKLKDVDDLKKHELIMFTPGPPPAWRLVKGRDKVEISNPPRLQINNSIAARDAAVNGFGITLLPRFHADPLVTEGRLIEVLTGWTRAPVPVHAVFPSSRYLSPKVRAFVDIARTNTVSL
jgi:DNA-binding transcriptional LysR family regulator